MEKRRCGTCVYYNAIEEEFVCTREQEIAEVKATEICLYWDSKRECEMTYRIGNKDW